MSSRSAQAASRGELIVTRNLYSHSLALLIVGAVMVGCSSGSGGSDVGAASNIVPTARPQVLNGGLTSTFREGSEVLLTGKASQDRGGPVIDWRWQQIEGPPVSLLEVNSTTVSFTAPDVETSTELRFELIVEDSTGGQGRAPIGVTILPAQDAGKFLSLDLREGRVFDGFKVVAALAGGAATGDFAKPFKLVARSYLVYPPRSNSATDCTFDPTDFASGIPGSTASGCFVELLQNLTPNRAGNGSEGILDAWPSNVLAPVGDDADTLITRWWNPRFSLAIPRLEVGEFNQRFVETGQRDRLLDGFAVHQARIILEIALEAPDNQSSATMLLSDLADVPIAIPGQVLPGGGASGARSVIGNDGIGLPTSVVIPAEIILAAIAGRESSLTSEVYYRTVDPEHTRLTLNAWLQQAGFAADGDGALRTEAKTGDGSFAHAVYLNNYDLGFGRDMYSRTDEFGNVFSFVRNFGTLEGAIRGVDSFVTVVMEYSPLTRHSDPTTKFVKFFTFIDDGSGDQRRVSSFDFDGRGQRSTPGNCVICHGGAKPPGVAELQFDANCGDPTDAICYAWPSANRSGIDIADGNLAAMFLPFDLGSLLFADTDPAIIAAPVPFDGVTVGAELLRDYGDFSRAIQLAQIRKLNQTVYSTYDDLERTGAARRLIEHWYGGVDSNGELGSVFDDSSAVPGWISGEFVPDPAEAGALIMNPPGATALYIDVYAQHCRSCHTNVLEEELRFDTYQKFMALQPFRGVFTSGVMPAARLTMDRLWSPFAGGDAPGEKLARHLADVSGEAPPSRPGQAVAAIAGIDPPSNRGDTVYLNGSASVFARTYQWSLVPPAGSAARLIGATSEQPMFLVDLPGMYEVTLTVNPGTARENVATGTMLVENRPPLAVDDIFSLDLSRSGVLGGSLAGEINQDRDPDGDPLVFSLTPGGAPSFGVLAFGRGGAFTYTYTGGLQNPPTVDRFSYRIDDGFGGIDQGQATILIVAESAASRPSAPVLTGADDASTAAGEASTFQVRLSWLASDDDVAVRGYNVYRNGSMIDFVAAPAPAGAAIAHMDSTVSPDTAYTYRVTAVDDDGESELSSSRSVRIVTSLRRNLQTGWGDGTDSAWGDIGCIGCHRGAPGGLTLRGSAANVFAELTEDAGGPQPYRVDPLRPLKSLVLCKPLAAADPRGCVHGGGDFLVRSDPRYQTLMRWIASDTPDN